MMTASRALQLQSMSRGIQKKYAYVPTENINVNLENKAKQLFGKLGLRHEKIPTLNHERKLPGQIEGVYKKDKLSLKKNPRVSDKKAEAVAMHEIYHHTQKDKGLELGHEESQANMIEKAYLNENQESKEELDFDLIYAHTIKQFYEHEELEQLVRVLGGDASSARRVYGNAMETIAEFNTKQKIQEKVQKNHSQIKKSSVNSGVRYKQSDIKYAFLGVSMNDLEEAWDTTVDGAEYLVDKTADGIEYAADKTVDGAIYVKDKAVEGAEAVVEAVESIADWTEEQIRELLSGLFETCASVANWIWGVIQGEFNPNPSVDQIITDVGIGFIPVVGQLADGRDVVAISIKLTDEKEQSKILNWVALVGILVGIIPGAGDAVKGVIKIIARKTGDFFSAVVKLLQKMGIDDTVGFIKKIDWVKIGSGISSILSRVVGAIKAKINEIINLISTVLNKINSITPNDVLKTIEGFKKYLVDGYYKLVALESFIGSKVDEALVWLKKILDDAFAKFLPSLNKIPIEKFNPSEIRFSQDSVSYMKTSRETGEVYTYDDLVSSMKKDGFKKGQEVDLIEMQDGQLTSIDNTRIKAAREANIEIDGVVHKREDLLTRKEINRFEDPEKGFNPKTWGDIVDYRINNQKKSFAKDNPLGNFDIPKLTGQIKPSTVEGFYSVKFDILEKNKDIIKRLSNGIQQTPNRGVIGELDISRLASDPIYIDMNKKTLEIVGITNGRHRLLHILEEGIDNPNIKSQFFNIKIYFIE